MPPSLTQARVRGFRRTVYGYFDTHCRDLPWRRTTDPYHIYVSEIMLQQTQVDRVTPKYEVFVTNFPSWEALAEEPFDGVLRAWQGLGYNRRARALHEAAKQVVREFGGELPDNAETLRSLPGIGPATAASISAFAFDRPAVFIETNIRAVFIHHFFDEPVPVPDSDILPLVEQTLDRRGPRRWYSALMDYGVSIKRAHANPSRRSSHHTRQSRFEGSTRQIRGKVLALLLKEPSLTLRTIERRIDDPRKRTRTVMERLREEGLIVREGVRYRIG